MTEYSHPDPIVSVDDVREIVTRRRPDWDGQEWIDGGVSCLCAEHDRHAAQPAEV